MTTDDFLSFLRSLTSCFSIKKRLTIILLILAISEAFSQSVDPLTGTVRFSVPLGQLQAVDISVPISIGYHGDALRVDDGQGSCGLNWSLSIGGSITRQVRGLPDEMNEATRKGWLYNNNALAVQNFIPGGDDDLASNCTDEVADWNFLDSRGFIYDTEPDLYFYNAPGISGQFVYDATGTPRLLTHDDVLIAGSGGSISITTNNGVLYTFSITETVTRRSEIKAGGPNLNANYYYFQSEATFISRWHLASIQSLTTGTIANFNYQDLDEVVSKNYQTQILPEYSNQADTLYELKDTYIPKRIWMASIKSFQAIITWENNMVKKVTLQEITGTDKKETEFEYESKSQTTYASTSYPIYKSFLKSLRIVNECNPVASFEFHYKNISWGNNELVSVPWQTKWGQDWFGFYNGQNDNKNVSTMHFYASENDGRRLRVTAIPSLTATSVLNGQDRTVSLTHQGFGALAKVVYPEGGFTEIEYEPHVYIDLSTNQELLGGGLRVKKIRSNASEIAFGKSIDYNNAYRDLTKEYQYTESDGVGAQSSGRLLAPIKLGYITRSGIVRTQDNYGENPEILYARVKEKIIGQGSRVFEYNIPGTFPETTSGEWKATKSRIARKPQTPCLAEGDVKNGYYTFPFPASTNYTFMRGFLTRSAEYSESGSLLREKTYTPVLLTANPQTIKGIRFEKISDTFYYGQYEILTGRVQVPGQEVAREWSEEPTGQAAQTTVSYSYNSNNMLQTITTTLQDNSISTQRFKYAKDFAITNPPATDTAAVAIKIMNSIFRHGQLIEQVTKLTQPGGTEIITGAQITLFRNFGNNHILPYYSKALPTGAQHTEAFVNASQNLIVDSDYQTVSTFKEYDNNRLLLSGFDDKKNKVAYHYATGLGMTVATLYNAKAQQAVFENFESTNSFGLTPSWTTYFAEGWTGKRSLQLTPGITLSSGTILKGENKYRISCWVKATTTFQISFQARNASTVYQAVILSNTVNNKWVYLEGVMDVTSVTSNFSLDVSANSTIQIDDVVFIPLSARISSQTSSPFTGVTSVSDDRGNSVVRTYDGAGRLLSTFDRERNLVSKVEYLNQKQAGAFVNANFTSISSEGSSTWYVVGIPVLFTAGANCGTGYTYQWKVDGALQAATTSALTYAFSTPDIHTVELKVTDGAGNSAVFSANITLQGENCTTCHPPAGPCGQGCFWNGTACTCQ